MSNADWWSRKLGGQPQPQPQYVQQQPQYAPQPQYTPQYAPQQQQFPAQQYGPPLLANGRLDVTRMDDERLRLKDVAKMWNKGEAARTEGSGTCPNCGSIHVFSMRNAGTVQNQNSGQLASSSPRCFECGWKPNYAMQGDRSNWI